MLLNQALWIVFGVPLVLGLAAAVWGFVVEPGWVRLNEVRIESDRWPAGRGPLRIVVLGDLHVGAPHMGPDDLDLVVARTNALQPDIVLLVGDYIVHGVPFGRLVTPEVTAQSLAALRAHHGVFAVLGNHDWWYDGPRVQTAFEAVGITVLENAATARDLPDGRLWIAGIADDTTRQPDARQALAPVPEDEPVIVITHDPAVFFDIPARAAAIFAGHMHGGQVYLPLVGALITPGRAPRRFAYGHIREDGKHLYVTSGLGTSILPVRFNMPPEIALVTLAAPPAASR